jgi:CTP synthase (UTP-ammonia lyase)
VDYLGVRRRVAVGFVAGADGELRLTRNEHFGTETRQHPFATPASPSRPHEGLSRKRRHGARAAKLAVGSQQREIVKSRRIEVRRSQRYRIRKDSVRTAESRSVLSAKI